jgi:di/tripeptidase
MNNLDDGYFDLKDYNENNYDDYNNVLELRTLSKSEFNKILKTIEETIEKAKKNKQ